MRESWAELALLWGAWAVLGPLFLWWSRFTPDRRRALGLTLSLTGLLFLVLALGSEGQRAAPTTTFLIATPYVTAPALASASAAYYVLTAVFLALGALGLGLSEPQAARLSERWFALSLGLAAGVVVLRFVLEKAAAPPELSRLLGVTWLSPAVGAFFLARLRSRGHGPGRALAWLLGWVLASRLMVVLLYAVASGLRLGTHFDLTPLVEVSQPFTGQRFRFEPGSLDQFVSIGVLPQLLFWTPFSWLNGLLGVLVASLALSGRGPAGSSLAPRVPLAEPVRH